MDKVCWVVDEKCTCTNGCDIMLKELQVSKAEECIIINKWSGEGSDQSRASVWRRKLIWYLRLTGLAHYDETLLALPLEARMWSPRRESVLTLTLVRQNNYLHDIDKNSKIRPLQVQNGCRESPTRIPVNASQAPRVLSRGTDS